MLFRMARYIDIYIGIPLLYMLHWLKGTHQPNTVKEGGNGYKRVKFWGIGNIVMLLPAVHAFKEKFGNVQIDLLTLSENANAAKAACQFEDVYVLGYNTIFRFVRTFISTIGILRKNDYNLIIDCEQFARLSSLFCLLVGRKQTVGFNTRGQHRHFVYTNPILYDNNLHMTRSFFSLLEPAGVYQSGGIRPCPFECKKSDTDKLIDLLGDAGIINKTVCVLMQTGTSENFIERRWPADHYAQLADMLINAVAAKIVFTGLKKETMTVKKVIEAMKNRSSAIDLCDALDFGQYISLIKLSDLVISADTASVHLASSLSVPVVGLFGPNTPFLYGPWGAGGTWFYKKLPCSPCITNYNSKLNRCRNPEGRGVCMKNIGAAEVFAGINSNYIAKEAPFRLKKLHD
jgi:heptosyltransferase-3